MKPIPGVTFNYNSISDKLSQFNWAVQFITRAVYVNFVQNSKDILILFKKLYIISMSC